MQRIMIISDTHRRHGNFSQALYNEGNIDMLIHLGDVEGEEDIISGMAGCECIFIAGNNDFFSPLDREMELDIAGKKIWLRPLYQSVEIIGIDRIFVFDGGHTESFPEVIGNKGRITS